MKQKITLACWLVNLVCLVLLAWQGHAVATGKAPDHIRPLVALVFSGPGETTPMAYAFTLRLGLLSVLWFLVSYSVLLGLFAADLWNHKRN